MSRIPRFPPDRCSSATSIVVTPYSAQLALVRAALDEAGFPDVPVGTVDKFQGQEAAVAIVSLAHPRRRQRRAGRVPAAQGTA